ncbi:MAG: hypothetical protein ABIK18_02760 [candidate division WOR-3 bacterium]
MGIETGIRPPESFSRIDRWEIIKRRVLELRGVKDEIFSENLGGIEPHKAPPKTLTEMLQDLRKERTVTEEGLKRAEHKRKPAKRTRKDDASWDHVIEKLVEEGLLDKMISRQALKKC